jgi:DNA-binding transcriptional MerR regulator
MSDRFQHEAWLTAAECARRIGLSVRTLRLYEDHGLITPRRTATQWRLYGAVDLARLNEVLALKHLGLSLSTIADLLQGRATDFGRMLAMQHEALQGERKRADRGLAMIERLNKTVAAGGALSINDLTELAKEANMAEPTTDAVAWRRYEQSRPRTEVAIDTSLYRDYAGHYQLDQGPFYVVSTRDGRLFTRVVGQADIEIFPEGETQFFMKTLPVQVTFVRDAQGEVSSLVHHQNGAEIRAVRVPADLVEKAEAELQQRIREKLPAPGSETIMRRVIAEHIRGEPDFDGMSPQLAELARAQSETVQASLAQAGALKSVSFRGVAQSGFDVYDVRFENADMEWGLALAPDGKIGGLYLRPSP